MAPSAVETANTHSLASKVVPDVSKLTGDERAAALKASGKDRPLDVFTYGGHPISGQSSVSS